MAKAPHMSGEMVDGLTSMMLAVYSSSCERSLARP